MEFFEKIPLALLIFEKKCSRRGCWLASAFRSPAMICFWWITETDSSLFTNKFFHIWLNFGKSAGNLGNLMFFLFRKTNGNLGNKYIAILCEASLLSFADNQIVSHMLRFRTQISKKRGEKMTSKLWNMQKWRILIGFRKKKFSWFNDKIIRLTAQIFSWVIIFITYKKKFHLCFEF